MGGWGWYMGAEASAREGWGLTLGACTGVWGLAHGWGSIGGLRSRGCFAPCPHLGSPKYPGAQRSQCGPSVGGGAEAGAGGPVAVSPLRLAVAVAPALPAAPGSRGIPEAAGAAELAALPMGPVCEDKGTRGDTGGRATVRGATLGSLRGLTLAAVADAGSSRLAAAVEVAATVHGAEGGRVPRGVPDGRVPRGVPVAGGIGRRRGPAQVADAGVVGGPAAVAVAAVLITPGGGTRRGGRCGDPRQQHPFPPHIPAAPGWWEPAPASPRHPQDMGRVCVVPMYPQTSPSHGVEAHDPHAPQISPSHGVDVRDPHATQTSPSRGMSTACSLWPAGWPCLVSVPPKRWPPPSPPVPGSRAVAVGGPVPSVAAPAAALEGLGGVVASGKGVTGGHAQAAFVHIWALTIGPGGCPARGQPPRLPQSH